MCPAPIAQTAHYVRRICLTALACVLLLTGVAQAGEVTDAQIANRRCLNCHGQTHIADLSRAQRAGMVDGEPTPGDDPRPGLLVDAATLEASRHGNVSCVACHADAVELPHAAQLQNATCNTSCHVTQGEAYRRGIHAEVLAKGEQAAPTCQTCHGGHNVLPKSDRNSLVHPLNVVRVCSDCHSTHHEMTANGETSAVHVQSYLESVHGKAITKSGLIVAATCADCHGSHDIRPSTDPASDAGRANIANTCGKCHVGVEEVYLSSIHGKALAEGNREAPVCSDCHTSHGITRSDTPNFLVDIVAECGSCHDKPVNGNGDGSSLYKTYRASYHGQVMQLGSSRAARCSDCHGTHDILPVNEPASRLSAQNRIETCSQCHPGANQNFVAFRAHADFHNPKSDPLLHGIWLYFIVVMSATFSFFGLHTLLWFGRGIVHRIKNGRHDFRSKPGRSIKRFNKVDRINHAFVIITFFGLTLTGMPLLFADKAWAQFLATLFGGVHLAGIIHRFFAILLFINFIVHAVEVLRRLGGGHLKRTLFGANSMLPKWKDVKDCVGMFGWFLGLRDKPRFGHFTYWEKFDYWAEIFGTFVIGGSGLLLWFPEFFSQWLPGWTFNIAQVIHGYEALLAVGFIFTIHFFNAHLRVEKFPIDDVMFTGQLPEAEFREEREVEYDQLQEHNELDALRVDRAAPWKRTLAMWVGIVAMAIGGTIVVLIVLAGLGVI